MEDSNHKTMKRKMKEKVIDIFKSENEDLKWEVAYLNEKISLLNKENSKTKTQVIKQKRTISKLTKIVSDLKEKVLKLKKLKDVTMMVNVDKDHSVQIRDVSALSSFNSSDSTPSDKASFSQATLRNSKMLTSSGLKIHSNCARNDVARSSMRVTKRSKRLTRSSLTLANPSDKLTPASPILSCESSYKRITRSSSAFKLASAKTKPNVSFIDSTPLTSRTSLRFPRREINQDLQSEVLSLSSCSVCGKSFKNVKLHKMRVHKVLDVSEIESGSTSDCSKSFNDPSKRIQFTIVTKEKDESGIHFTDLDCSMRPSTKVKQVKKSYCKRFGLDKGKIRLVVSSRVDETCIVLLDEQTVQGLEGSIVGAVMLTGEEIMTEDLQTSVSSCSICGKYFKNVKLHIALAHSHNKVLNVSEIENTSDCSKSFNDPSKRVHFNIVSKDMDESGLQISDLECAMRPSTRVKQVKKSYCKRFGLEKEKISLKLVESSRLDETSVWLLDEQTVEGLEGSIVEAVRLAEEEVMTEGGGEYM